MNPLAKILAQSKIGSYATAAELRSHIGRPLAPCPGCQSPYRVVLQSGVVVCPECGGEGGAEIDYRGRGVALLLAVGVDGLAIEVDRATLDPIKT